MWRSVAAVLLAAAANVVVAHEDKPLAKVVTMLTELRDEIMAEAESEAATYDKFACFCKDTMKEKSSEISDGENSKNTLEGDLGGFMEVRMDMDTEIKDKTLGIGAAQEEIEKLTKTRHDELLEYETNEVDLTGAVQALEAAIRQLKATQGAVSLAQLAPALNKAVATARSVGIDSLSQKKAMALLKSKDGQFPTDFDVPDETYSFSSGGIVETLEGLLTEFKDMKNSLQSDEVSARQIYEQEVQTKEGLIENLKKELEEHKADKASASEDAASTSEDLSMTSAELLGDKEYLQKISESCHEKAVLWDQRTQARANELSALTQALAIIQSEDVSGKESASAALGQLRQVVQRVEVGRHSFGRTWSHPLRLPKVHLSAAAVAVSSNSSSKSSSADKLALGKRKRIATLLGAKAKSLNSAALKLMASSLTKDPLAKVKIMINELIERLLKEAAEEANHKGWCDDKVSKATIKRDKATEELTELNAKLEKGEVRIAKLSEHIADLDSELLEVEYKLGNATELRANETQENEKAVEDAQKAKDAVADAIKKLEEFYGTAKNEAAKALIQTHSREDPEDIPDAGFDDAYAGKQDAKDGVIGMLEVLEADFARAAKDAEDLEAKQKQDFLELETELGKSKATKEEAHKANSKALTEANATAITEMEDLTANAKHLNFAIQEMEELRDACLDGGQSPEERKAQRQEEIDALNQALEILS